jgi:tetratricopeptide (TPR) repeat protein
MIRLVIPFLLIAGADAQQPQPAWREALEKAVALRKIGSPDARAAFLQAAEIAREVPDGGLALAQVSHDLAMDHQGHGRHDEAERLFRQAISTYEGNPRAHPLDLAASMHGLAISCRGLARGVEAESWHRRAIGVIEGVGGPNHPALVLVLAFLGSLYLEQGRVAEAEPVLTRALAIGGEKLRADHPDLAPALTGLAMVRRLRAEFVGAHQSAARALRILEATYGPDSANLTATLHQLGLSALESNRLDSAAAYWGRALEITEKRRSPDHPDGINLVILLAHVAGLQGRRKDEEALYWRAARISEKPGAQAVLAVALHHLATYYAGEKQHERAEPLFRRSLEVNERYLGSRNAEWGICAADFARSLDASKRYEEAEHWTRAAITVADATRSIEHPFFLAALEEHARLLRLLKRKEEAREVSERLKKLMASGAGNQRRHTVSMTELRSER